MGDKSIKLKVTQKIFEDITGESSFFAMATEKLNDSPDMYSVW